MVEHRLVPVPSDAGAWRILAHEHLGIVISSIAGELGHRFTQRHQPFGDRVDFNEPRGGYVVPPPKRHDPTVCLEAVKVEGLQWKAADLPCQSSLRCLCHEVGLVAKAGR